MSRETSPPVPPFAVMTLGIAAVSTGAIFAKAADAHPVVIAAYRVAIASLVLLPVALWKAREELRRIGLLILATALGAGGFLALHFAAWISSLNHTSVANSVVLVNTNPLWVALLTPLLTGEAIGRRARVSIGLSVLGAVVIGFEGLHADPGQLMGDGLALAGGVCAAFYLLLGKRVRARLSLIGYIFLCYASAAVFLWAAVGLLRLPASGFTSATWGAFVGMALFSQLIGHSSYNWALKWVSASAVAVGLLGEPIGATLLAYLFFGETVTVVKVLGMGLILVGIYLSATESSGARPGPH
jgi:drug/metabolite transporter (DMT)-like permease